MPRTKAYEIEVAALDDVFELTILARASYDESVFDKENFKFNTKKVGALIDHTVQSPEFLFLRLSQEEEIVGYFFAAISECFFALEKQTMCLSWYIKPEHRGRDNSLTLLNAYEKWAKEGGAVAINMIDIRNKPNKTFEKLGYRVNETTYVKGVT